VAIFAARSWFFLSRHFLMWETVVLLTATLYFYKIHPFLLYWKILVFQVRLRQKGLCHAISVKSQFSSKFGWSTIKVRFVFYIHPYVHKYTHTYIFTYTHTYIHTYICTYIHPYIHTYIHTYVHSYIHTYSFHPSSISSEYEIYQ